jgi:hypothetical protein
LRWEGGCLGNVLPHTWCGCCGGPPCGGVSLLESPPLHRRHLILKLLDVILQLLHLLLELGLVVQLSTQLMDLLLKLGDEGILALLLRRLLVGVGLQAPAKFAVHLGHDFLLDISLECAGRQLSRSSLAM